MKNLSANTAKYSLIQANDATGLHIQDDGGNGLFIKDGGNIGIGTSAPDVKLAVVGTTSANAYTFYQNTLTDASEAIHRPTTGQLAIRANSQERVRIDVNGNVGIGTTSPGSTLDISSANPAVRLTDETHNTAAVFSSNNQGDVILNADLNNIVDNSTVQFKIDGSEKMRITSDGKIGIGITEPKHELHIYNTTSAPRIRLQCGNSSNAALLFGDAGDDTEAGVLWNAATESLAIRGYNNTDRITILNNGNVGVGTVIPDVRLVVADNHPGDDVTLRVWNSSTTDNSTASLRFTNTSSTNYDHGYIIAGRTPSPYMQFGVADSVTAMHIDSIGNVGVGTVSPTAQLDIKKIGNDDGATLRLRSATSVDTYKTIGSLEYFSEDASVDSSGLVGSVNVINTGTHWRPDGNNAAMTFNLIQDLAGTSSPVEAMRIDSNGNVGVGTTSPSYTLEVKKSVQNWVSRIYNTRSTTGSAGLLVRSDASDFDSHAFGVHAGGSYKLSVRCDGKIGIGTSDPQYHFTIKGPTTSDYDAIRTSLGGANEDLYHTTWRAAGGFKVVRAKGTQGNLNIGIDTPDGTSWTGTGGHIDFFTNSSGEYASRLFINRNGNVGVGDGDFPNVKFSVRGSLQAIYGYRSTTNPDHDLFTLHSDVGGSTSTKFKIEADGDVWSSSSTYSSDARLKTEIEELGHGLDTLKQLQPKQYKMIGSENKGLRYGFVAQEIETVLPDLVRDIEVNDDKYKSLEYNSIIAILTKSIQEQQAVIEQLKTRIDTLENK